MYHSPDMVFPQNATGKLGHPFARAVIELDAQKARMTAKLTSCSEV